MKFSSYKDRQNSQKASPAGEGRNYFISAAMTI
jgi:hypothetical protein